MNARGLKFSLVLCTVGRREPIAAFCESLLRQNRDDYELILVDQNNDDRLDAIAKQYGGVFPLRHVKSDTRGLSRARNVGLRHVTGELVGFPDDDCEYFDGYLDGVANLFDADPTLGGLTGYPTAATTRTLPSDWQTTETMELGRTAILNRCQEFTIFVRRAAMNGIGFNDLLGVGAGTPWGADEGPDFLIRVVEAGARVVFYPKLFVYHPDKTQAITPDTLKRAASYARGRGAYFRLHRHSAGEVARALYRPAVAVGLYTLLLRPMRARYYLAVLGGLLRGLSMPAAEVAALEAAWRIGDIKAPAPRAARVTLPAGKVLADA